MIVSAKKYVAAFAGAAVIAMAVSACGGGGEPTTTAPTSTDVDLSSVTPGFTATARTLEIEAGESVDHGDIAFACAGGSDDCVVMVIVTDGTVTATSTGGTVSAMNSDDYRRSVTPMDVGLSPVTPGFMAEADTIRIEAGESEDHGEITFACAPDGRDCVVVVVMVAGDGTISATSTGGEVTASDAGEPNTLVDQKLDAAIDAGHSTNSPNLDSTGAPEDSLGYAAITDAMHADIDGRPARVYELVTPATGTNPAVMNTLVIYSNTDFLTSTDFEDVYPFNFNADSNPGDDALEIASGASGRVDESMIGGENLPTDVADDGSFRGRFDGASGVYTCTDNSGCTLTFDSSGNVTGVVGDMHFTPDQDATVLASDPEYMYFGYWLRESEDRNGDPTFEAAGLYDGHVRSSINDVQSLEGSATYEGSATGLYARRWTDAHNTVVRRRAGQFTADAVLTANFGGESVAAIDHYSISGTISNFMAGDQAIDPSWHVELQRADFGPLARLGPRNDFSGGTQDADENGMAIQGPADPGDWSGRFFGEVDVDADPGTNGNQSTLPSGIAGSFDGHFNNGDVIGAFAADRQD